MGKAFRIKRLWLVIATIIIAVICAMCFVACGGSNSEDYSEYINTPHTHKYVNYMCSLCGKIAPDAPATEKLTFTEIKENEQAVAYSVSQGDMNQYIETFIKIPSEYAGLPVTSVEENAFQHCSVKSIEIPNTVTSIGGSAFEGCSSLMSIEIPDSVTSIGGGAFWGCSKLISVTIGSSVTSIGEELFRYCSLLSNLTVQSGNAVYHSVDNCIIETKSKILVAGCKNSVIPDDGSVISIGNWAFDHSEFTTIAIPNYVTSIGRCAFSSCSSLKSIEIPNSVTSIGIGAFSYCSSLKSIEIPNSVTSIGENAFSRCSGLTNITVQGGNAVYHSDGNCIIETGSKTMIAGCKNSVIPTDGSVISVGDYVCSGCDLTSITIPSSVTSIGEYAFYGCNKLTSVTIDNGVTSIGKSAFYDCQILTSVVIPNSITNIGDSAFSCCYKLKSVKFNGTKEQWNAISKVTRLLPFDIVECADGTISKYGYAITV